MRIRPNIRTIFTFLLAILTGSAVAQYKFENAVVLTNKDGLPSREVRAIVQSPDGFIWIGTGDGLCRFDGTEFKIFQYDQSNPHSIIDNRIWNLTADSQHVWIGTQVGVSRLDLASEKFYNYQFDEKGVRDTIFKDGEQQIRSLLRGRDGEIWVGTRNFGVARYVPATDQFEMYRGEQKEAALYFTRSHGIHSILSLEQHRTNDSIIWAGTILGLLEINKYSKTVRYHAFNVDLPEKERWGNVFRRMYHHADGRLYAGGWGEPLFAYDPETGTVEQVVPRNTFPGFENTLGIDRIGEKSPEEIWVSMGAGLMALRTDTRELTFWKKNDEQTYNVALIDDQDRIWSTSNQGLHLYDPVMQQFSTYSFEALNGAYGGYAFQTFSTVQDGYFNVAARNAIGIFHFDPASKNWSMTPFPKEFLDEGGSANPAAICPSPNGEWWLSVGSKLLVYSPEKKEIRAAPFQPVVEQPRLRSLLWDHRGRLWIIASLTEILRWDPRTGAVREFRKELLADEGDLDAPVPEQLFEDSRGNIWFKRHTGMGYYDQEKDSIFLFLNARDPDKVFVNVHNFTEDKLGHIWVSGGEGWLGRIDTAHPQKGVIERISLNEKFGDFIGSPYDLKTDRSGIIWGWTNNWILRIDPLERSFERFSFQYGQEDPDFFELSIMHTGELVFCGDTKMTITHPRELTRNKELPQPYLTGVNILERPLDLDVAPNRLEQMSLKHWENFFSFDFSAKGFTLGSENHFRYRLLDFEEEWIDARNRRFANYTNVPGGDYVFQLQAANNEGIWNPEILEIPVHIDTAWWLTWTFRISFLILVLLIGYQLYRYRINQIRKEEKLKTSFEKKLANVEMSALRAQMNPHFLFNSLNSIENFIIKNDTRKASEYLSNFARLIRLILQNSRSNYVNLRDEIEALQLYMGMEQLRFRNKFHYSIHLQEDLDPGTIDIPPMLLQPYVENAIWHGLMHKEDKSEGKVEVRIGRENGYLQCVIEDNGIGREKAAEIQSRRPSRGRQSVGLKITEDRIAIINKLYNLNTTVRIIDLHAPEGEALGTRVELMIPV